MSGDQVQQDIDAALRRKRCVVLFVGPLGIRKTVENLQHLVHIYESTTRGIASVRGYRKCSATNATLDFAA